MDRFYFKSFVVEEILVLQKSIKIGFSINIIPRGLNIFNSYLRDHFEISIINNNTSCHHILCVTYLYTQYFELSGICQFGELYPLKTTNNERYEINPTLIDLDCKLYLCMLIYIIPCEETV